LRGLMTGGGTMLTVFVVSDSTGKTAVQMVRAALAQFEDAPVTLVQRSLVRTPEQVRAVVEEAAGQGSFILHTLVSHDLRRLILEQCRLHAVDAVDMMGPVLDRLATHLKLTPQEKPGLFRQLVEARSREIEAVDFAFAHDDGRNIHELDRAEVVVVGISRTMKTPTMLYLAYRGWFSANVPIVPEVPMPEALTSLPPQRVFCLFMSPNRLVELRRVRAESGGIPVDPYATPQHVRKELLHAEQLCLRHDWRRIDTTSKSVEEAGREIIALLPERAE